jgi:hypothetical protein
MAYVFIYQGRQLADLLQRPLGQNREVAGVLGEDVGPEAVNGGTEILDLFERLAELSIVLDHICTRNMALVRPDSTLRIVVTLPG